MTITWWQSLLIAIVPALITAGISLFVAINQLKRTKKELVEKYEAENKLYISKTRFGLEFEIYKEISEKLVTAVMHVMSLFPIDGQYAFDDKFLKDTKKCLNDAMITNNKYAIYIPQSWYDKFTRILNLCRLQIDCCNEAHATVIPNPIANKNCYERTALIKNSTDELISELRTHINSLGVTEVKTNAD